MEVTFTMHLLSLHNFHTIELKWKTFNTQRNKSWFYSLFKNFKKENEYRYYCET